MYVSWHVALTVPPAAAVAAVDPLGGGLLLAGGVLIDADHYLDHVWFNRDWSLRRAYRWHRYVTGPWFSARPGHRYLALFHTLEVMILVGLAGALWRPAGWALAGMLYHLLLDKLFDISWNAFWIRAFSVIQWALWASRRGWQDLVPPEEPLHPEARPADIRKRGGVPALAETAAS